MNIRRWRWRQCTTFLIFIERIDWKRCRVRIVKTARVVCSTAIQLTSRLWRACTLIRSNESRRGIHTYLHRILQLVWYPGHIRVLQQRKSHVSFYISTIYKVIYKLSNWSLLRHCKNTLYTSSYKYWSNRWFLIKYDSTNFRNSKFEFIFYFN